MAPGITHLLTETETDKFIVALMECFGDWHTIKGRECLALYPVDGSTYSHKSLGLAPLPGRNGKPVIFDEIFER
jgi:hypothetical protein